MKPINNSKKDSKSKLPAKKDASVNESFHSGTPVEKLASDIGSSFNFERFVGYVKDEFAGLVECEKLVADNQKVVDGSLR